MCELKNCALNRDTMRGGILIAVSFMSVFRDPDVSESELK